MNFHGKIRNKKHPTKQIQNCEETRGHRGLKQMLSKMVVSKMKMMKIEDDHDDDNDEKR